MNPVQLGYNGCTAIMQISYRNTSGHATFTAFALEANTLSRAFKISDSATGQNVCKEIHIRTSDVIYNDRHSGCRNFCVVLEADLIINFRHSV